MSDTAASLPVPNGYIAKAKIERLLGAGMSWRKIGREMGVSYIMLWKFYNKGIEPKNNEDRRALGLSIICPRCGLEIDSTP